MADEQNTSTSSSNPGENRGDKTPTQPQPVSPNTVMAVLAYIGPLVIISYMVAKDEAFVKFHIKQVLVHLVGEVILWILGGMFWQFWFVLQLANLAILIFTVIGIVNAVNGKEKELPFIGAFAKFFNF